jgi:hypothetical protein
MQSMNNQCIHWLHACMHATELWISFWLQSNK